jgi:plastocyanin
MKALLALVVVSAALLVSGCASQPPPGSGPDNVTVTGNATGQAYTVEITASGFSPSMVAISAGDTVAFVNRDSAAHWPASDPHPIHTGYPEPGGCIGSKFDACTGLAQGESFTFTFTHKGSWGYHDHLNPTLRGTVIVQ